MSHNDPQLTAYLLGELSPTESAALELQLAASPELRQELDALRGTVAALQSAFAQHVDIQPAVPALDREKLHTLLRSAVVSSPVGQAFLPASEQPQGKADRNVCPTSVVAPVLLATAPTRGSNSRSWLVAGAVLVVGGLIGLSQMETGRREESLAQLPPGRTDRESLELRNWTITNGRGAQPNAALGTPASGSTTSPFAMTGDFAPLVAIIQQETSGPMEEGDDLLSESITSMNRAVVRFHDGASPAGGSAVDSLDAGLVIGGRDSFSGVLSDDVSFYKLNTIDGSRQTGRYALMPFGYEGVNGQRLVEQDESLAGHTAFGRGLSRGRGTNPVQFFDRIGETALGLSLPPVNALFAHDYPESLGEIRAKGLSLQRGEVTELKTESLMLAEVDDLAAVGQGLSLDGRQESSGRRRFITDAWGELPALTDFSEVQESSRPLSSETAPEAEGEVLAQSGDESKLGYRSYAKTALPQSLTVTDYEEGFVQLGKAVENWDRFSRGGQSRGIQSVDSKDSALSELHEVSDLDLLITNQQTEFKSLRKKTPSVEGKPLTDVAPEVAKNAQLALLRVRRELAHEQAVWYYREGYVRQLEATLAAAEQYAHVPENDFTTPEAQPLSTFGIDVDTASYSNVRRFVEAGQLPPPDAVRIEELINSFQYEGPKVEGEAPLAVAAEVSVCPWQPQHQLLRVALKGKSIDLQQRPPARLVFLVDTSGSMSDENKLPLVKQSLRILVEQMREQDRLSIVTYSDNAGLLLDSTGGDKREAILAAIEGLSADGSTNGEAGLKLAYEVAVKQFGEGATNRVMLCTDGDFNVGESADSELVKLIEKERQTGVFLNIFGFGSGNLKDAKLEAIADKGNGQYIYIDGIKEARKTLLNELTGTLYTIAKDVKLQIEFNPAVVGSYRLVGYENRAMAAQDFANDKVDSGDMGAGHSVVALYEIVPPGAPQPVAPKAEVEPLKYQRARNVSGQSEAAVAPETKPTEEKPAEAALPASLAALLATELCTIRVRYKQPTSNESTKIETVVSPMPVIVDKKLLPTSRDHVWATAVAQFGLLTRHSTFVGTGNYSQVLELAQSAIGDDPTGQRREFVTLVRQTQSLSFERERQLAELSRRAEEHRRVVEEIKTIEKVPDVMTKASCSGKYKTLLRRIEVADDQPFYGDFKDYGRWAGTAYKVHQNLPSGYWVYVAPHWYIWGESTEQAAGDAVK